jgi:GNAT superfamily N-acetyltransferase
MQRQTDMLETGHPAFRVLPVTEFRQFRACLELRFATYQELGYVSPTAGGDLDPFDWSSIHFAVLDANKSLAGTIRLVIPSPALRDDPCFRSTADWCSRERAESGAEIEPSASIPVLETLEVNALPSSVLGSLSPGELSRIIVAPGYRGRGLSQALVTAVRDRARQIGCDALFLQCLPSHVALFRKYGFEVALESLRYPHLTVPDRAWVMECRLR